MRAGRAETAVFLCAVIVGCGGGEPSSLPGAPDPGAEETALAPRTILLVVLDGARADHLSVYGHPHDPMPALSHLAERGIVFEEAFTGSTGTNSALATLFTGTWPDRHRLGSLHDLGQQGLRESALTLAERLSQEGWRTVGVVALPQLEHEFSGLAQGFSTWIDVPLPGEGALTAQEVRYRVLRALEPELASSEPLFACVHFADTRSDGLPDAAIARPFLAAHLAPFQATHASIDAALVRSARDPSSGLHDLQVLLARSRGAAEYDAWKAALHDAALATIDAHLQAILDALEQSGRLEEALVVVTGTRGEIYEGQLDPDWPDFPEELVRVPLVAVVPGLAPRRVGAIVRTIDVVPTVLELLGLEPAEIDGASLLGLVSGSEQAERAAVVWSAGLDRLAIRLAGYARESGPLGPVADLWPLRGTRLTSQDEPARKAFDLLGATLAERSPSERWMVEHGASGADSLRVQWRFQDGFVRAATLESDGGALAPSRPGEGTRIDGAATLAGPKSVLAIDGSSRSLSMRLVCNGPPESFDERAVLIGAQPLASCFLPRVPSSTEKPWPADEQGVPASALVDFTHRGDSWWQLHVGGEADRPVRILLARFPPTRPDEELAATVPAGEVRAVSGRLDALWIEGKTPFEVNVEKKPSEDLALAVSIGGEMVPVRSIRWRGRCFAPEGEIALYLPDWMGGASDALDDPTAGANPLEPGQLRIFRATSSLPPGERVGLDKAQLGFVRWLEANE